MTLEKYRVVAGFNLDIPVGSFDIPVLPRTEYG
jgi:hypothetical protein